MALRFRPHHFLCTLCFQGKGYSPAFIRNFSKIVQVLNAPQGENTLIQIVSETDSICAPCPNRAENTCTSEEKITALDKAHAKALELKPHETITWSNAKQRIKDKISLNTFHTICASCNWKPYGLCEKALSGFLDTSDTMISEEGHV